MDFAYKTETFQTIEIINVKMLCKQLQLMQFNQSKKVKFSYILQHATHHRCVLCPACSIERVLRFVDVGLLSKFWQRNCDQCLIKNQLIAWSQPSPFHDFLHFGYSKQLYKHLFKHFIRRKLLLALVNIKHIANVFLKSFELKKRINCLQHAVICDTHDSAEISESYLYIYCNQEVMFYKFN